MRLLTIIALILAASWLTGANATEVYRWSDENGVTQYSDTPPANAKYERMSVRSGAAQTNRAQENEDTDSRAGDAVQTEADAARAQRCAVAKQNLQTLASGFAQITGEDGELRALTAEELEAQIKGNQSVVDNECKTP